MPRDFGTTFVTQCAPVMAGLKAANLFRWVEPDAAALAGTLASWRAAAGPARGRDRDAAFLPARPMPT